MTDRAVTLGEVCLAVVDCEHKTAPASPYGPAWAIGTPALAGDRIDFAQARRISDDTYREWTRRMVPRAGDLILAREAPVGRVALVPPDALIALGQRTVLLRPDPAKANARYLHALLASHELRQAMLSTAEGSTVAHLNVSDVRALSLPQLAGLPEQRAIADILGVLDDKIESNGQVGRTVRSLANAEYENSLVRGCRMVTLGNVAAFHNSRRVPLSAKQRSDMPGDYPYFGATGVFDRVGQYIFDDVIALVGEDGSVVNDDGSPVVQYVWGKSWVNNHAHVLTGAGISTELLVLALASVDVRPQVTGAVQAKLSMGNLRSVPLELPLEDHLPALEAAVASLFAMRRALEDESRTLAALRDALLPEFLSGRLRVPEAREQVEAVV